MIQKAGCILCILNSLDCFDSQNEKKRDDKSIGTIKTDFGKKD